MLSQPTMDPIISRLRPRSVQEIIDVAFRLYRKFFLTFLAITAIIFVPVNLGIQLLNVMVQGNNVALQRDLTYGSSSDFSSSGSLLNQYLVSTFVLAGLLVVAGVLGGLLQYLSQGALTSAVAESYMERPVSFGGAYRQMFKRVGPLLGAIVLQVLIGIGIWVPLVLIFALSIAGLASGSNSGSSAVGLGLCFLGLPLFLITLLVYLFIVVRLRLVVPVIMVEGLGPVEAIRRSWRLVQNYWWRTLALVIVLGLLNLVISAGPAYLVLAIVGIFTRGTDPVTAAAITGTGTVIMSALFLPLELVSTTLYYFDLRVRKEGFDIEQALDRRYASPSQPTYYPGGQIGQDAPPPVLGQGTQPQPYPQQGYGQQSYPQSGYTQPQPGYPQPYPQPQGDTAIYPAGTPTLATPSVASTTSITPASSNGPITAPLGSASLAEQSPAEGAGFSTPSIAEQAAQPYIERNTEASRPIDESQPGEGDFPLTGQPGQG